MTQASTKRARYSFGGDEFLFVEFDAEMNLDAHFRSTLVARSLHENRVDGVTEICPANASLLIRFNPDVLEPEALKQQVQDIEDTVIQDSGVSIETRIIEVPVWYDDPVTAEVGTRFREGFHQDPNSTDLEYAARVNDLDGPQDFISKHHQSPWLVTMVGFVAGLPFMFQLVEREQQLEVPKYLSPRTDTAKLTVGHGGCFAVIYSVRGAGGYQMFGLAAAPIYNPELQGTEQEENMIVFKPGDIVKFKSVDEAEYNEIQKQVEAGTFKFREVPFTFDVDRALNEGSGYNSEILEALNG
ncbi:allophanate hydrolase subunit 1 [Corynebacteriaceae bacterium 6-324]